ncbi:unnamed protein product [Brassica rapa subsp. trilocularis]
MEATLVPSSPAFLREVEVFSDPPMPASVPGKRRLTQLRLRRLLAPEGGSFQSYALLVMRPVVLWVVATSLWCVKLSCGSCWCGFSGSRFPSGG